jgi:hypothetical protein
MAWLVVTVGTLIVLMNHGVSHQSLSCGNLEKTCLVLLSLYMKSVLVLR